MVRTDEREGDGLGIGENIKHQEVHSPVDYYPLVFSLVRKVEVHPSDLSGLSELRDNGPYHSL